MKQKVFLGQHALYSSLGTTEETLNSLIDGKSGIVSGPLFHLPVSSAPFPDLRFRSLEYAIGNLWSSIDQGSLDLASTVFIYCAAKGDVRAIDNGSSGTDYPSPLLSLQAQQIIQQLGIKPARTISISNACASGAAGVEIAKEYLEQGMFSSAILFGFDSISEFVATGFHALGALSPKPARPFDSARNGLTLGEGVALAILHTNPDQQYDAVVVGAGSSNDANHRTGPSRTGDGLYRAMLTAAKDASDQQYSIGAVKCHGTATAYNDAMEAKAIKSFFNDKIPPCFSLKGALGHTSGAGSLMEFLIAAHLLKLRIAPPTTGFYNHGVDEPVPISSSKQTITGDSMLCLSAGFGGLNSAVIIKDIV
ncbi:MAG TPA: beta-ketoacyl synthase N-terminal-like domain-containing protein [Chitinispirillaceae bacterium]|nr:beta-ketoacyl synthase N-terminal-like domain-containing protein [Chitinispirillaceae bacterium]